MKQPRARPDPRASSIFTAGIFIFLLWHLFRVSLPFIEPLFWAAVLAVAMNPIYRKLARRLRDGSWAAGFLTVLVVLILAPFLIWGLVAVFQQLVEFADTARRSIEDGSFQRWTQQIFSVPWVQQTEKLFFRHRGALQERLPHWAGEAAGTMGSFAALHAAALTKSMLVMTFKVVLALFMLFFFLRDGRRFSRFVMDLLPLESWYKERILREVGGVTNAVIQGIFAVAVLKGIFAGILFLLCGVAYAPLLGMATVFASFIPLIGSATVWLPVGVMFLLDGDYARATIVLAVGGIVINSIDNVVQPLLVGKKIQMPFSVLMLAMLGGMLSYGMAGVFIGPLVVALFLTVVPIYRKKFFRSTVRRRIPASRPEEFPERLAG
ncbi:MAG TPA: AI-2E family transporter [Verrucomicrobiae bacterium]|jgi:predicted PurR-regulated permease PerM|nr:AI-2E family transporter [Verrucomicrobiae bacterium]